METSTLTPELLHQMNAYWRAAKYLSVGQIYLYDNPLLREPLKLTHVKPLVVGHWGTTRARWPMIALKSPKGWTGPKVVDGLQTERPFRVHQVPLLVDAEHPDHVKQLESAG